MVGTQRAGEYLATVARGGQGQVSLYAVPVSAQDSHVFLRGGWTVIGLDDRYADPRVLCIQKRPLQPEHPIGSQGRDDEVHRAARAWERIAREYDLLKQADGHGTPRVFPDGKDVVSKAEPWRNSILMEYVPAPSLWSLVQQGCGPVGDQLVDLAWGLFDVVGGPEGRTGLHGRDVAHRDLMADQILIPSRHGRRDWANPVVVDLGLGFHPDLEFELQDPNRSPGLSSVPGGKPGYQAPERAAGYAPSSTSQLLRVHSTDGKDPIERRRRLKLGHASDLWTWGMTLGFAATGTNIFGIVSFDDGTIVHPQAWLALLQGQEVEPPGLASVPAELRAALAAGLRRSPDDRDRAAIAAALPQRASDREAAAALAPATAPLESKVSDLERRLQKSSDELTDARVELLEEMARSAVASTELERLLGQERARADAAEAALLAERRKPAAPAPAPAPAPPLKRAPAPSTTDRTTTTRRPAHDVHRRPSNPLCPCRSGFAFLACHGSGYPRQQMSSPVRLPGPLTDAVPCPCGTGVAFVRCHGR